MAADHPNNPGTDYCPHCCVYHVIGKHPRDGETERQYWKRINNNEPNARLPGHLQAVWDVCVQYAKQYRCSVEDAIEDFEYDGPQGSSGLSWEDKQALMKRAANGPESTKEGREALAQARREGS